jgi:hypothetical protein
MAMLFEGKLRVLQFHASDLDEYLDIPVLRREQVKRLLSINTTIDVYDNTLAYITCLLEDNRVVYALCRFPSRVKTMTTCGGECWTQRPGTKYIHCLPSIHTTMGTWVYLADGKLRYARYNELVGGVPIPDVGEAFPSAYTPVERATIDNFDEYDHPVEGKAPPQRGSCVE